jgi:hypothetical protein
MSTDPGIWRAVDTPKARAQGRGRQMREQGYADGYAGRRKRWDDPQYLASYRRGKQAREAGAS